MKIIGKVKTIVLQITDNNGSAVEDMPSKTYNIVSIEELSNGKKVYITDQEYKPNVPLILVEDLVETYTPISD